MRFVDREQCDRCCAQQFGKPRLRRAFGCDVEQIERAGSETFDRLGAIGVGAGQCRGADADRLGPAQLVVHQRDERRYDDHRAVDRYRWELVAQGFARAGRHYRERVRAGHHAVEHR